MFMAGQITAANRHRGFTVYRTWGFPKVAKTRFFLLYKLEKIIGFATFPQNR